MMCESTCGCPDELVVATAMASLVTEVGAMLGAHMQRREAAAHAVDYLRGLLAPVARKNGWQLAEQAGYDHPRGIQRVLARYVWDAEAVRDALRTWVTTELGDPGGILVLDETGFPKQGTHSVGVQRQYCGTLGKIGNCQVGVFLGYTSPKGHAAIDRALYLPATWLADPDRAHAAGIPAGTPFQTKPQLGLRMLERALDADVPAAWVVADEVYGSAGALRRALEARDQAYVLAVRGNELTTRWSPDDVPERITLTAITEAVTAEDWQSLSCGEGAQGPRWYDWAYIALRPAPHDGWCHAALIRRHPVRTEEVAAYLVYARNATTLTEIVAVAGARWTIEEVFKLAKGQVGLDQYEVRSWQGWYRHSTLALLALAILAIGAAQKRGPGVPSISPSPSPNSGTSWCASSGRRGQHRTRSLPGHVGDDGTSTSRRKLTATAV